MAQAAASHIIGAMQRRRLLTAGALLLFLAIFIALVAPEWPAFQQERHRLDSLVGQRHFDFVVWGAQALQAKGVEQAGRGHAFLAQEARRELVLSYLDWVGQVRALQNEITRAYADPAVADAESSTQALQAELSAARAEMARLQPLAEAVLQEQVAEALAEEGFGLLGSVFPPVAMHMTPLPQVLIVSPREEIRQIYNVPLTPGLAVAEQEALEAGVAQGLDRSALVVPIGGMGFYPAMILESSNILFLADTIAHEWAHHWLTLRPLGIRYFESPEMRTINETVASLVGTEVGLRVVQRHYPQFAPPPAETAPPPGPAPEPPAFDFRAEMAQTRVEVDRLLAAGQVSEAEAYMEQRRQLFVSHGYALRVLNQAYFAFYGAYADTPGAAGEDPVGPAVLALRQRSSSLADFLQRVGGVTSFEELQALLPS